jgi:hypothetical protein
VVGARGTNSEIRTRALNKLLWAKTLKKKFRPKGEDIIKYDRK